MLCERIKMNSPLISIVIPLYNKSEWIISTLESVSNQTYLNWECLIIDDGSTDDSLQKVSNFVSSHPGKWRVYNQNNLGQSAARNYGISLASGEYVAFLDADDLWHPHKLHSQIEIFRNDSNLELVLSSYVIFRQGQKSGFRVVRISNPIRAIEKWFYMRGFGGLIESTGLAKKSGLLHYGGFNENLSLAAGLDLSLSFAEKKLIASTKIPYVFYRLSPGQFHKKKDVWVNDLQLIVDRHLQSTVERKTLDQSHADYLFWSARKDAGKLDFVIGIIECLVLLDFSKLSMLYSLASRNLASLIFGTKILNRARFFLKDYS
jgi:glycosyltransferase involved in cell wall biosynthesis